MADLEHLTNGQPLELRVEHEADRLASMVRQLRAECEQLRKDLATAEADRDSYKKAVYASMRGSFEEFRDVDIPGLAAMSAGPVEILK